MILEESQTNDSATTSQDGKGQDSGNAESKGAETKSEGSDTSKSDDSSTGKGPILSDGKGADGEGKQGQPSGNADGAELEITLPEGVTVNDAMLNGFKALAKEIGLNSENASKLAGFYAQQLTSSMESQAKEWQQQSDDWEKQLRDDTDFGGKNFDESVQHARRALMAFGGKELVSDLDKYGLGNLPSLAKAFVRVGKAIQEDSTGADYIKSQNKQNESWEDRVNRFYETKQET